MWHDCAGKRRTDPLAGVSGLIAGFGAPHSRALFNDPTHYERPFCGSM